MVKVLPCLNYVFISVPAGMINFKTVDAILGSLLRPLTDSQVDHGKYCNVIDKAIL